MHNYLTCFTAILYIVKHWENIEAIWLLQRQTDNQINTRTWEESEQFTIEINKVTLHVDHTFILCSQVVPNNFLLPKTLFQHLLGH